jgi:hypothetical protein
MLHRWQRALQVDDRIAIGPEKAFCRRGWMAVDGWVVAKGGIEERRQAIDSAAESEFGNSG